MQAQEYLIVNITISADNKNVPNRNFLTHKVLLDHTLRSLSHICYITVKKINKTSPTIGKSNSRKWTNYFKL